MRREPAREIGGDYKYHQNWVFVAPPPLLGGARLFFEMRKHICAPRPLLLGGAVPVDPSCLVVGVRVRCNAGQDFVIVTAVLAVRTPGVF